MFVILHLIYMGVFFGFFFNFIVCFQTISPKGHRGHEYGLQFSLKCHCFRSMWYYSLHINNIPYIIWHGMGNYLNWEMMVTNTAEKFALLTNACYAFFSALFEIFISHLTNHKESMTLIYFTSRCHAYHNFRIWNTMQI